MEATIKSVPVSSGSASTALHSGGNEGDQRLATVTTTATASISRRLSLGDDFNDTNSARPETRKEVARILLREHEMLGSVKHLVSDLLKTPRYENLALVKETKTMTQDLMDRWIGEKIPVQLDTQQNIQTLYTKIDELRHSISANNFEEKAIPNELLLRYESEILQRENEIGLIDEQIEAEILQLGNTPMQESEKRVRIDQQIGELLVMKRFLTMYIGKGNHSIDDIDIDSIGRIYGCHIKSLRFFNKIPQEYYSRTISIEHHEYDPVIRKIFREFTVGMEKVDLSGLKEKIAGAIPDEYLIQKMVLGEKRIVTLLDHYKNMAVDFLAMPELKRNPLLKNDFNKYAVTLISGSHDPVIQEELAEWKKGFDRTEKESPDMVYKEFCYFASKRIAMALKNLTHFEGNKVPKIVENKYRNAIVDKVLEIANLQNQEIDGRRKSLTFDRHTATKKGTHTIKFIHALNNGTFFAL